MHNNNERLRAIQLTDISLSYIFGKPIMSITSYDNKTLRNFKHQRPPTHPTPIKNYCLTIQFKACQSIKEWTADRGVEPSALSTQIHILNIPPLLFASKSPKTTSWFYDPKLKITGQRGSVRIGWGKRGVEVAARGGWIWVGRLRSDSRGLWGEFRAQWEEEWKGW